MRILLCNIGYLLGDRDALGGYLPSPRGALFGNNRVERQAIHRLIDLLTTERPDVVCLVEVDRGSFRTATNGQLADIVSRLGRHGLAYTAAIFNKYGSHRLVGKLPFFRKLGNGVLLPAPYPVTPHYLETGMKRLVIEVSLPNDLTLYLAHLSVRTASRQRQLAELAALVSETLDTGHVILAGDLNTFHGMDELDAFRARTGLEPHVPGETVPERPFDEYMVSSRAVDLFLTSPEVDFDEVAVLPQQISDHRPVVVDARV